MDQKMSTAHWNYYYIFIQRNEAISSKTYVHLLIAASLTIDTNNPNVYQL